MIFGNQDPLKQVPPPKENDEKGVQNNANISSFIPNNPNPNTMSFLPNEKQKKIVSNSLFQGNQTLKTDLTKTKSEVNLNFSDQQNDKKPLFPIFNMSKPEEKKPNSLFNNQNQAQPQSLKPLFQPVQNNTVPPQSQPAQNNSFFQSPSVNNSFNFSQQLNLPTLSSNNMINNNPHIATDEIKAQNSGFGMIPQYQFGQNVVGMIPQNQSMIIKPAPIKQLDHLFGANSNLVQTGNSFANLGNQAGNQSFLGNNNNFNNSFPSQNAQGFTSSFMNARK